MRRIMAALWYWLRHHKHIYLRSIGCYVDHKAKVGVPHKADMRSNTRAQGVLCIIRHTDSLPELCNISLVHHKM